MNYFMDEQADEAVPISIQDKSLLAEHVDVWSNWKMEIGKQL